MLASLHNSHTLNTLLSGVFTSAIRQIIPNAQVLITTSTHAHYQCNSVMALYAEYKKFLLEKKTNAKLKYPNQIALAKEIVSIIYL